MPSCWNILKAYLFVGCIFDIGLSIGAFIAGAYLKKMDDGVVPVDGAVSIKGYVAIGFFVLGGLCILLGLIGILAFWKKWKCFQVIFVLINFLFFIIFTFIFAVMVFAKTYSAELDGSCNSISFLKDAEKTFTQLIPYWCNNSICPCSITATQYATLWTPAQQATFQIAVTGGTTSVGSCQHSSVQSILSGQTFVINLLTAIESNFSCSGICTGSPLYFFSDVSQGPPSHLNGCFTQIKDAVQSIITGLYVFSLLATIVSFLNFFIGCLNCCCGPKDNNNNDVGNKPFEQELQGKSHDNSNLPFAQNNYNNFNQTYNQPPQGAWDQNNQFGRVPPQKQIF